MARASNRRPASMRAPSGTTASAGRGPNRSTSSSASPRVIVTYPSAQRHTRASRRNSRPCLSDDGGAAPVSMAGRSPADGGREPVRLVHEHAPHRPAARAGTGSRSPGPASAPHRPGWSPSPGPARRGGSPSAGAGPGRPRGRARSTARHRVRRRSTSNGSRAGTAVSGRTTSRTAWPRRASAAQVSIVWMPLARSTGNRTSARQRIRRRHRPPPSGAA